MANIKPFLPLIGIVVGTQILRGCVFTDAPLQQPAIADDYSCLDKPVGRGQDKSDVAPSTLLANCANEVDNRVKEARALYLFEKAMQQNAPLDWIDKYVRNVAGDTRAVTVRYGGQISGEAKRTSQYLDRNSELIAAALAQSWVKQGSAPHDVISAVPVERLWEVYGSGY